MRAIWFNLAQSVNENKQGKMDCELVRSTTWEAVLNTGM